MKIWILSDLHLEFSGLDDLQIPDADVCVVSGDLQNKGILNSLQWLDDRMAMHMPTIFIAGNHEFYRAEHTLDEEIARARAYEPKGRLSFLENSSIEFEDVVFTGSTLWADFDALGEEFSQIAMRHAARDLNDYRLIKFSKQPFQRLLPGLTYRKHVQSLYSIENTLENYPGQKVVVVTHHAPSLKSVEPRYLVDMLTPSFASDLESVMIRHAPTLWIHGHVHHHVDYMVDKTRVIAHPRGYPNEECHRDYDFGFVVEI